MALSNSTDEEEAADLPVCFVVMPISDPQPYESGHFAEVFRVLIKPACKTAGFKADLASTPRETNFLDLHILRQLYEAPLVLCDLSSRNPNVFFELGLRQAFDKPVVLIKDDKTDRVFDTGHFRTYDYSHTMRYERAVADIGEITKAIRETSEAVTAGTSFNSIVRLLPLIRAVNPDDAQRVESDPAYQLIMQELAALRAEVREFGYKGGDRNPFGNRPLITPDEAVAIIQRNIEIGWPDDYNVSHMRSAYGLTEDWVSEEIRKLRDQGVTYNLG